MISEILEVLRLKRKTNWVDECFEIMVYIMSEGTAQGQPRPLQVCKETMSCTHDKNDPWDLSPERRILLRAHSILHDGYRTTQSNGVAVQFSPHVIYKVTWKRIEEC